MKIKAIIETVTSARDTNGNCYHFAIVTNTETGEFIRFETGGDSNARAMVGEILENLHGSDARFDYKDTQRVEPKRRWGQLNKAVDLYEHQAREPLAALLAGKTEIEGATT